jgi:hypothetical protein
MTRVSNAEPPHATCAAYAGRSPAPRRRTGIGLWLLVVAGFALLIAAYVVAFRYAREAQIREVPVNRTGGRP